MTHDDTADDHHDETDHRLDRRRLLTQGGAIGAAAAIGGAAVVRSAAQNGPQTMATPQTNPAGTPVGTPAGTPVGTPGATPIAAAPPPLVSTAGLPGPTNLDHRGVTLLPSRFLNRINDAIDFLGGELSIDTILRGFRQRAGLPAPGDRLDGWATKTTEATFGQWVSALARLGQSRNDPLLQQRAIDLVAGWTETVPNGNVAAGTYGYEKYVQGLVDVAKYAGYTPALDTLLATTRWASATFDRSRTPATPQDRDGRKPNGTLEWYTLPENTYRAYQMTGNQEFRDFAALWHYDSYWDTFLDPPAAGQPWTSVPTLLHAYSHVNTLSSAAMVYEVTGDERYLTIIRNAYRWLRETQTYATGGYGPGEYTVPNDGTLGSSIEWRSDTAETGCGTWAGFKLTTYLMRHTGEAFYADWAERLLYNGIGATLPVQIDGRHTYYSDYRLGAQATRLWHWDHWACCSGTYFQDLAHLYDMIYLLDGQGPLVSLFVPSELTFKHNGQPVTLRQETLFPQRTTTKLTVNVPAPVDMALRVRVPGWSRGMTFTVNGAATDVAATAGQWATIERTWAPGDVVEIELGAGLTLEAVDQWHPKRAALLYGPVVLAQEGTFSMPFAVNGQPAPEALDGMFTRADEGAGPAGRMVFKPVDQGTAEQPIGIFRPLMDYEERTPYRIYLDLDAPRYL